MTDPQLPPVSPQAPQKPPPGVRTETFAEWYARLDRKGRDGLARAFWTTPAALDAQQAERLAKQHTSTGCIFVTWLASSPPCSGRCRGRLKHDAVAAGAE